MAENARSGDTWGLEENLRTAANAVTLLRLIIATLLFAASAYLRNPLVNLAGLAVYWLGDVADGFLARRLDQETLFGAQWDILADRLSVAFFYLNTLVLYPDLAPAIVLFLVQFMVVDHYLSNQYLRWPIMSPNYFYRVDHRVWSLNWSKLGKACNTGLVTLLLLATKSNAVVLPVVLALLAVKLFSCVRVARLHEPTVRLQEPHPERMAARRIARQTSKHLLTVVPALERTTISESAAGSVRRPARAIFRLVSKGGNQ